jgi:flagellar hook-length control protein FliK
MAVQMAMSANDLAQVCAPAKTAAISGDAGAAGAEFRNILLGMRESVQKTAQTAPKEPKTPVSFAFLAGEDGESAADFDEPPAELQPELETTPDDGAETPPPSRFDPDVFLAALEAAAAGKRAADAAKNAETSEPETEEDKTEDTVSAQETDAPDSGENAAQPAPVSFAEVNAPAQINPPAETNGKTEADAKDVSDQTAERVRTADAQIGETGKLDAEDAPRGTKPGEPQATGAKEFPDTDENTENTDNAGRETSYGGEQGAAEKSEPRAPKTAARASDRIQGTGERDGAAAESAEKTSAEKPSSERAEPSAAAGQFADISRARTEAPPLAQAPLVYTLTSADKFGEGLRSVLTIVTREGGTEARIVVEPPALGRVDISLRSSSNGVEANFRVDNEELRQMVQKQLDSLKESLQSQGIHVSGMTVDIKNNEGDRERGNTGTPQKGRRQSRLGAARLDEADDDIGDDARVLRLDLEQGLLHWVA